MAEKPEGGLGAAVQERVHTPRAAPTRSGAVPKQAAVTRDPMREPMRAQRYVSDEEILRMFQAEEENQFEIADNIIPRGFRYVWKCHEVYGKSDRFNPAQLEKKNMVQVMAEDHPGYFMPKGHTGHVIRDGLGLYKMEAHDYSLRERYDQIMAKRQVQDQEQVLGIAPAGHGPRDHPALRPQIRTNYEAFDVE